MKIRPNDGGSAQVVAFAFMGAAAPQWWPSDAVIPPQTEYSIEALEQAQAHQALNVVTITVGVARAVLAIQYLYILLLAKRAHRPRKTILVEGMACIVSCLFCVASAWIDSTSSGRLHAKISLLYAGTLVEVASYVAVGLSTTFTRIPSERIGERIVSSPSVDSICLTVWSRTA
jgi:hypothetical protein